MNKRLLTFGLLGLLAVSLISAVVIYQTINVDITVNEALSVTSVIPISIVGEYPGETISENITIQNDADVPLYTTLTWAEITNVNFVNYTTGGALSGVQTLQPGSNILTATWIIEVDSPTGTFDGNVTLTRVASP